MKTILTFDEFNTEYQQLLGLPLSHMDPYFQKIDLHFGTYTKNGKDTYSDFIIYVSGFWQLLGLDTTAILDEQNNQNDIVRFFQSQVGEEVMDIKIFENPHEIFLTISNGNVFHFQAEEDGNWVD